MNAKSIYMIFFAFLAMLLLSFGCGDDDDDDSGGAGDDDDDDNDDNDDDNDDDDNDDDNDDDTTQWPPNDHIDLGKGYLEASAAGYARMEFDLALDEVPGHPDALYGLILGNSLHEFDVISIIVAYAEMILGFETPERLDEDDSLQDLLDTLVAEIMDGLLYVRHDELMESYDAWVATANAPDFELVKMPIILNFDTVAEPGGLYDDSEAEAAMAVSLMVSSLIHHLTALNVDLPLSYVFFLGDIDFGSYSTMEVVSIVVDYILRILHEPAYPDFLTFGTEGVEEIQAAGLDFGKGFMGAYNTFNLMVQGSPDQEVLGYDDTNENGQWDEGEHLVVPPYGVLSADQDEIAWEMADMFYDLAASFYDGTEMDVDPDNPNPFKLSGLNALLRALGVPGFIPDWDTLAIDFGAFYADPQPEFIRTQLLILLTLLQAVLPTPPDYI